MATMTKKKIESAQGKLVITETPSIPMIPKYKHEPTDNPHLFRVVNRKGDWIVYWHDVEKKYKWSVNHIIRHGFPKDEGFYNYLLSTTKEEAKKILETAGERGSRVHEAIRDLLSGNEIEWERSYKNELTGRYEALSDDEWECLVAFVRFWEDYKLEAIAFETTVSKENYAGTVDFYGAMEYEDKRIKVLLDWKSGSGLYPDYKLQTAAYAYAMPVMPEYTGVVRLGTRHKKGYELVLWDYQQTKKHYQVFRSAYNNFELQYPEYKHDDEQYPAKLAIKIKKGK